MHVTIHLFNQRCWLLTGAIWTLVTITGIKWYHQCNQELLLIGSIIILLSMIRWWQDIVQDGTYRGLHAEVVTKGLRWCIILFIISEHFSFISFSSEFSHKGLSSAIELAPLRSAVGINPLNALQIPLSILPSFLHLE